MAFDKMKLMRKHTVYPASSQPQSALKNPSSKGPYGSWCTPVTSPTHAELPKTHSSCDPSSRIKEDAQNKHSPIIPIQKVKLLTFVTPKKCQTKEREEVVTELTEIKEYKTEDSPIKKDTDKNGQKVVQEVETPQSPVPSSPSRSSKYKGFKLIPLFDPFMPIDPQGRGYISWLFLVNFCYSYNAWCVALRATFPYQTPENTPYWMTVDYICDFVYVVDTFLVKPKLMFLHEGFWVDDPALTRDNYKKKIQYKFDMASLLPLDLLYLYFGTQKVILRLPRLLKLQTFWEFHQAMDRVLASPYVVRIGKSLFYIFYLIHVNACTYYAMSSYIGLASNGWVYDNQGNAYLRCFYFATKTATSIGKNPKPENTMEYLFMTGAWLMGVFVFALLIGQIRDIIATATRRRTEYRKTVDGCRQYLSGLNMPSSLQRRITCWFNYTWGQQRCFDEDKILNSLPYNMKRDVALEVHMSTLSKVQLFRDCSTSLLRDLVLQLRPVSFLPGDVVVRRGDVGHQMYIIMSGECYVMSGDESEVLARLSEGSVFGEISLLGLPGLRRRTATVRSRGYSNLFALSRQDLNSALQYHTEAANILRMRADQILRENAERQAQAKFGGPKKVGEGSVRRRKSANSGDSKKMEEKRKRSASGLSRRRLSAVSESKKQRPRASPAASDQTRTPVPTIVVTAD